MIVGDYLSALSDGKLAFASHPRPHRRLDPTMRALTTHLSLHTRRIPKPGKLVSPVHRVLLPDAPAQRYSLTFFRYPHCAATLPASNTRRAERRAARRARQRKRHLAALEAFNTLVAPAPDGDGQGSPSPHSDTLPSLSLACPLASLPILRAYL